MPHLQTKTNLLVIFYKIYRQYCKHRREEGRAKLIPSLSIF